MLITGCAAAKTDARLFEWQGAGPLSQYPASITGVDGRMILSERPPFSLKSGPHAVSVHTNAPLRMRDSERERTLYFLAEPCHAYYVAARHSCSTCPDWAPVIVKAEPFTECDEVSTGSAQLESSVPD